MAASTTSIGNRETALLRWVAQHGPVTVGQAADGFGRPRRLARTTVQTMLERLRRKRRLGRREVDGVYRYASLEPASELLRGFVRSFVDGPLAGSITPFVAYLSEVEELSPRDRKELEEIVERLEERRKGDAQ